MRSNSRASASLFEIKGLESNAKRLNHHCPMRQTGIVRQYGCLKIGKSGWKTKGLLLGFALALLAAMTWGMLPIAVRQVLKFVDAPTLVWVRFTVAAAVLFVLLALGGRLPKRRDFSWHSFRLLLLGVTGISANFVLIAQGLHYISPTTTQVLWQISPFTMIVVGVLVFKDRMTAAQKIGLVLLLVGLLMFFNDKFGELSGLGAYAKGVLLCAAGSMAWVCYAVAQKLLSAQFGRNRFCC